MPDGTPNDAWWAAYRQLEGEPEPSARPGTYAALIKAYQASPEWGKLSERTRKEWDRHLRTVKKAWGHLQVRATEPRHVKALRNAFADIPPAPPALPTKPLDQYKNRPAAADNLMGALAAMLKWCIPEGWRNDNPCRDIPKLGGGEGYAPWSKRAIDYYRKHGKRHLWWVAAVALYTGQRQSDVVGMLKGDVRDGRIRVLQDKTGKELWIPIHRDLQTVLEDMGQPQGKPQRPPRRRWSPSTSW
jgi:integrase